MQVYPEKSFMQLTPIISLKKKFWNKLTNFYESQTIFGENTKVFKIIKWPSLQKVYIINSSIYRLNKFWDKYTQFSKLDYFWLR